MQGGRAAAVIFNERGLGSLAVDESQLDYRHVMHDPLTPLKTHFFPAGEWKFEFHIMQNQCVTALLNAAGSLFTISSEMQAECLTASQWSLADIEKAHGCDEAFLFKCAQARTKFINNGVRL